MRLTRLSSCSLALFCVALTAEAQSPLLHEYIEPNPAEDVELSATTQDGAMPAAIETEGGVVPAPRASLDRQHSEHAYGGSATPDSIDASYRVDRDTTRPDSVSYDEPFIPALAPFKRLYAYDSVDEGFELVVRDKALARVEVGGKPGPQDDQFYADLFVDLAPQVPVRVPSVAPGSRALVARTEPDVSFQLERDRADNWFMTADVRRRVRLVMQLAAPRAAFSAELADPSWGELLPQLPPLPPVVRDAALEVARQLGVSQQQPPRQVAKSLIAYFRGFSPSEATPKAARGPELYRELALSRKGVCRHRAYAFMITALGVGLPTRMVRNEAHAWVEIYDGGGFHRVDLGGAAGRMDLGRGAAEHVHRPPADPHAWPEGSESGQAMLSQSLDGAGPAGAALAPSGSAGVAPPPAPRASGPEPQAGPSVPAEVDARPRAVVSLRGAEQSIARGKAFTIAGTVRALGEPCTFLRVDVSLRDEKGSETWLGAFPTDAQGNIEGRVTVPFDVEVGKYAVVAHTPGSGRCGASR
jgi:Transglutaminase-like superfamily